MSNAGAHSPRRSRRLLKFSFLGVAWKASGTNANLRMGGIGADGYLLLFRSEGDRTNDDTATVHIDGQNANLRMGGSGADGDLLLFGTDRSCRSDGAAKQESHHDNHVESITRSAGVRRGSHAPSLAIPTIRKPILLSGPIGYVRHCYPRATESMLVEELRIVAVAVIGNKARRGRGVVRIKSGDNAQQDGCVSHRACKRGLRFEPGTCGL